VFQVVEIIQELNRAFNALNERYFQSKLPKVVITAQTHSKVICNGWFWENKWSDQDGNMYHELNISAEFLNRSVLNLMTTLQHSMIHIYCYENGIKDTSRNGRYHNYNFKQEAERRGLLISKDEVEGWSLSEPSIDFEAFVHRMKIKDIFNLNRNTDQKTTPIISKN